MSEELTPFSAFDSDEIGWLLRQLAKRRSIADIKKEFDYAFAPKVVSGGVLLALPTRFPELFRQAEKAELADISASMLAHVRLRLEEIENGLKEAKELVYKDVRRYTDPETGEEKLLWVVEKNFAARAKFIELAQREEFMAKRFMIERWKLQDDLPDVRKSGFKEIKVDSGTWDDDEDVVVRPDEIIDVTETEDKKDEDGSQGTEEAS